MKTKRVNDEFHRLDVKLPIAVYEQISEIAVNSFNAKVHHISNKPELSPTLLYLLELGIESFSNGNEKKPNTDNYTDNIPITNEWVKELIAKELSPIQSKLDELSGLVYRYRLTDNYTDDLVTMDDTDTLTDTLTDNLMDNIPLQSNFSSITEEIASSVMDEKEANTSDIVSKETEKDTLDIGTMLDSFNIKEGVIEDSSLLYGFFTDVFKKLNRKVTVVSYDENGKVKNNNLSKIPNYYHHRNETHKLFDVPPQIWEHLTAIQKDGKGKWIWTRI